MAADLLSQAEHDEMASAILITTSEELAKKVSEEVDKFVEVLSRKEIIEKSLENYGYILETPKLAWRNKDLLGSLKKGLKVPMAIDTDVNGSCLGEVTYGCAKGLNSVIYITIGTGVGVGVWVNGGLLHGMLHPEGGHILLNRHPEDTKGGVCPSHPNCFELCQRPFH